MQSKHPKTLLILSQTFIPDPASVGQHMADVAIAMAARGFRVKVYTSARGYENPLLKYPSAEEIQGVEVRRLAFCSFGKSGFASRMLGAASFLLQATFLGIFLPHLTGIFFSTSPPLTGLAACAIRCLRKVQTAYWAMDLNPDQLVATNKIKAGGRIEWLLEIAHRVILRHSDWIFVLDRFMASRLLQRGDYRNKMTVIPPWPHDKGEQISSRDTDAVRAELGLRDKFVVMYSGNHTPSNPLQTLLDAAVLLRNDDRLRFVFAGGGLGKKDVERYIEQHSLKNVISLPYRPLAELGSLLGAADIQVVSLGEGMVGIIHPCKIYGAMAAARPVLYLGPTPSHASEILETADMGWTISHGDTEGMVRTLLEAVETPRPLMTKRGYRAYQAVSQGLTKRSLCEALCDQLEKVLERHDWRIVH